jgi:hypothetical protein
MNKGVLISLSLAVFLIYNFVANAEPSGEEGGSALEQQALWFLEMVGGTIAGQLGLDALSAMVKSGANALRARGVKAAAQAGSKATAAASKAAAEAAEKAAKNAAANALKRSAATQAEKAAIEAAEAAALREGEKAAIGAAEEAAIRAAEQAALKEATGAAEEAAIKAAEAEALKAAEEAAIRRAEGEAVGSVEEALIKNAEKEAIAAAEEAAIKAAEDAAMQEAVRLSEQRAIEAAEEAALKEAEKIAEQAALDAAAKAAEAEALNLAAREAAKIGEQAAARAASLSAKIGGMMDSLLSGPAGWIMFAITTSLYLVLGLDPSMFEGCKEGYFDPASLPAWAQGLIGALPVLGDLFTLLGGLLCIREGCPEGHENRAGLCHPPCPEGYKSDGASICYKQYGDYWENKGFPAAPTITSVTKTILTNTGVPATGCPEGKHYDAGCWDDPPPGYTAVSFVAWADSVDIGAGRIPDLKGCDSFAAAEGWVRSRDDGTSCWEDWACNTYCDGNWNWNDGGYCHTNCNGCGCIKKALWERQYCADGGDLIDGLCYSKCPTTETCKDVEVDDITCTTTMVDTDIGFGMIVPMAQTSCIPNGGKRIERQCTTSTMKHIPGMPYLCQTDGPLSIPLGTALPICPAGTSEDSLGLCYNDPPAGFVKSTLGMMEDVCPEGTTDFLVGCTRESKFDVGGFPLDVYIKGRESYYGIKEGLPEGF